MRRCIWRQSAFLTLLAWSLCLTGWAADGRVTKVEPVTAGQGETVLLTMTGEALPQGTLVIEFYPQQIALQDILAASDSEIQALVKVAHTAPPGKYNVMVYNQRGEEAFGAELLEVTASVITPVFKNYDPKTIADAATGFALLLTGEFISAAAVEHLSMDWQQNGKALSTLKSTFSMGGNRSIVCAVEGQPPAGQLRGRIYLDGVPIYLVELMVEGGSATIVGHTPAELKAGDSTLKVRLLGSELTAIAVQGLQVELSSAALTAKAQQVILLDSASCQAQFTGPLPDGEYTLSVVSGGSLAYSSPVRLIPGNSVPEEAEGAIEPPAEDQAPPETAVGETTTEEDEPASETVQEPQPGNDVPERENAEIPGVEPEAAPPIAGLRIEYVEPVLIDPSAKACRFTVTTSGIDESLLQELTPELSVNGAMATLLLSGVSAGVMTCVFGPPPTGWPAGSTGELALRLASAANVSAVYPISVGGETSVATAPLTAEATTPEASGAVLPPTGDVWAAQTAYIASSQGMSTLAVGIAPPSGAYDLALLEGSFTLLPDELGYVSAFDNLMLTGKLQCRTGEGGALIGECPGNYVSGSLMVTLRYQGGTPQLSMLHLDAPLPQARIAAPAIDHVVRDSAGDWQPAELRWTIDFSPLVLADAQFIKLLDANGNAAATVVVASGTQAVLDCPAGALAYGAEVRGQLQFGLPVRASGAQELVAAVQEQAITEGAVEPGTASKNNGMAVEFATQNIYVCPEGLWVELVAPQPGLSLEEWRDAQVETGNLLLQPNLAKFTIEVKLAAGSADNNKQAVALLLRRDPLKLPNEVYELLSAQLLDAGACQLALRWPELGGDARGQLQAVEQAWAGG